MLTRLLQSANIWREKETKGNAKHIQLYVEAPLTHQLIITFGGKSAENKINIIIAVAVRKQMFVRVLATRSISTPQCERNFSCLFSKQRKSWPSLAFGRYCCRFWIHTIASALEQCLLFVTVICLRLPCASLRRFYLFSISSDLICDCPLLDATDALENFTSWMPRLNRSLNSQQVGSSLSLHICEHAEMVPRCSRLPDFWFDRVPLSSPNVLLHEMLFNNKSTVSHTLLCILQIRLTCSTVTLF